MPIVRTAISWIGRFAANVNRMLSRVLNGSVSLDGRTPPASVQKQAPGPALEVQSAPIDQPHPAPIEKVQTATGKHAQRSRIELARPSQVNKETFPAMSMEFEWGRIEGIYRGGWAGPQVTLYHGPGNDERIVDIEFESPADVGPHRTEIVVTKASDRSIARYSLSGGEDSNIRITLTEKPGRADIVIQPSVCLSELPRGMVGREIRELAIRVRKVEAGNVRKLRCIFDRNDDLRPVQS